MKPRLVDTPLAGLFVVELDAHVDDRGFFLESWHRRDFAEAGLDARFVQEGHSGSSAGVLRGLHYQDASAPLGKLVRCTVGEIYDVAVDIRSSSPTFGGWHGVELSAANRRQLWVPPGFAHGFVALTAAEVQYKQTGNYTPSAEGSIAWNDTELAIDWPVTLPTLSPRDAAAPSFADYRDNPAFG